MNAIRGGTQALATLWIGCFLACGKTSTPDSQSTVAHALAAQAKPDDIPDAEAEQYYRAHPAEFMAGERVRVSDIHTKDRKTADKMLTAARALAKTNAAGFATLARTNSTAGPHRMGNGDLGVLDADFPLHPAAVIKAAFALVNPGDISPVVSAEDGFHVLRLVARQPKRLRPFAQVKAEIKARLFNQRRAEEAQKAVAAAAGVKR